MNREDVIRMAREADTGSELFSFHVEFLERFAALVAAAEREECAKVCDEKFNIRSIGGFPREASVARSLTEEIRARK